MNAICSGFKETPKMCRKLLNSNDISRNIGIGVIYIDDGYKMHHVVGVCLLLTLSLFLYLYCYRRSAKREMKEEMDRRIEFAVNRYVQLSQNENDQ